MKHKELGMTIKVLQDAQDYIKKEFKAEVVGVFGSYVLGQEKEGSDLDVLVMFLEGANLLHLVGLGNFLEEKIGLRVDIVPIDTIRKEIKEQVLKEAVFI